MEKGKTDIDQFYKICGVSTRTVRDRRKEKFTIPENVIKKFPIKLPQGGLRSLELHGPPRTPEGRIKGGRVSQFIMDRIDKIYTDCPFYGVLKVTEQLCREGTWVNHKRIQRLMNLMGLEAIRPRPNLSLNSTPHPVFPYLLRDMAILKPNQVWGTDITYIRVKQGFVYLTAFIDWFSRYVLSWKLSISLEADFCLDAAVTATTKFGVPEITNSDQGSQYTSEQYLNFWTSQNVKISMDARQGDGQHFYGKVVA